MDPENLTHIGLNHLFFELKQLYPSVPDGVVTKCMQEVSYPATRFHFV